MAEEIKVTLAADSSQLTAEFKKAQLRAEEFGKKTLPLVTRELDRTFLQGEKLRKGLKEQTAASKQAGQGLLTLAYFADDAQYGMKGILNNIPGLVQGFGGGAGLAGVISVAALALYGFQKGLKEVTGVANIERLEKGFAEADRAAFEAGEARRKETAERRQAEAQQKRIAALIDKESERLREVLGIDERRLEAAKQIAQALEDQRQREDAIAAAKLKAADATGSPAAVVLAQQENERVAAARAAYDLAAAQARVTVETADYSRILRNTNAEFTRYQTEIAGVTSQLEALRDVNNQTQEDLGRSKGRIASLSGPGRGSSSELAIERVNVQNLQGRANEEGKAIAALEERLKVAQELEKVAESERLASRQASFELVGEARRQVEGLREAIRLREELRKIEAAANEQRVARSSAANDADLNGRKAQGQREFDEYYKSQRADEQRVAAARREFAIEDQILRLRERGRNSAADAIEKEHRLHQEAKKLAEQLGVTDREALKLLRERERLHQRINEGSDRPSKIRRSEGIQIGDGARRLEVSRGLGRSRGLRASAERIVDRERTVPDRSEAAKAASYYERSLQNEEKMISIFQNLGVIG